MTNVVVVGSQWGDEGKGKIVDWLSERADVVVRFQGGHNAGHTLVIDGVTYKLALLPSGVVRPDKLSVIGNGVVIDPWALIEEIERLRDAGVAIGPERLVVAENASLILPLHRNLDNAREVARGNAQIGTTGRGIGPAYEDKVGRRAIRVCDLADKQVLAEKLKHLLFHHNAILRGFGEAEIAAEGLLGELLDIAPKILPYARPIWRLLDEANKSGQRILFEGAQGAMLDIDHGTYPYVTSSNTVAGQAAAGAGFGPRGLGYVLGITKAYTTRVGAGPFPTELGKRNRRPAWQTRPRIRHQHRAPPPVRLVRWRDGAPGNQNCRDRWHRADQAGRAGWTQIDRNLHRIRDRRREARLPAVLDGETSGGKANHRDGRWLEGKHRGRAVLGRIAGDGDQVYPANRRADRGARNPAFDQPGARRHDHGAGSLRRIDLKTLRFFRLRGPVAENATGTRQKAKVSVNQLRYIFSVGFAGEAPPEYRTGPVLERCAAPSLKCSVLAMARDC